MNNSNDEELLRELKRRVEEQKQTVDALNRINDELLQVNKRLEESEALKSHFISNISNEIVNPFTAIVGLSRSILALDDSQMGLARKMAGMIFSEAFHLDYQLKNIFMAASLEAGNLDINCLKTNILKVIQNLEETYRYDLLNKHLELVIEHSTGAGVEITCDVEKVELMLSNIINNAILFSDPGKTIIIRIINHEDFFSIEIEDQGPGIAQEDIPRIFDRFHRVSTQINSVRRGNGLGLSVSKALSDFLGAAIEVESEQGRGSLFRVVMPVKITDNADINGYSTAGNETIFEDGLIF
ncbi:MAG: HAMP domain-containing sensor histidine kinase [Bacteroidetes bacterium]|nr:HAMP domain-containing sensor histidine kinase [Bacteroidota bacterium]